MITTSSTVDRVFSPFEVVALDVQGQSIGRPVSDLLGGALRERVPFSAYLFYKWAGHPGAEPDDWGEALGPDRLGELHEQYLRCGIRDRDDTGYRRSLEPGYGPRTW